MAKPIKPALTDVLHLEELRNRRDARAMLGQIRGSAGKRRMMAFDTHDARQLGLALKHAGMQGTGTSISIHSKTCKTQDAACRCSVLVLVPGATA